MNKWMGLAFLLLVESCAVMGTVSTIRGLECWSDWYNVDSPNTDDGDFELVTNIKQKYDICTKRIEIEAQTVTGISANATGQVFIKNDPQEGFTCLNAQQAKNTTCLDYKVRFRCPTAYCKKPLCWTEWFDRDDPSGSGDWEDLADLYTENPKGICEVPLDIEVRTVEGTTVNSTKDHLIIAKDKGVICKTTDNPQGCHDWKVRFLCPYSFCFKQECWTKWYARGSPTDLANWGVLAALKTNSTTETCPEFSTEIKATINTGANITSKIYDENGVFLANIYRNTDLSYDIRFMCNMGYCDTYGYNK